MLLIGRHHWNRHWRGSSLSWLGRILHFCHKAEGPAGVCTTEISGPFSSLAALLDRPSKSMACLVLKLQEHVGQSARVKSFTTDLGRRWLAGHSCICGFLLVPIGCSLSQRHRSSPSHLNHLQGTQGVSESHCLPSNAGTIFVWLCTVTLHAIDCSSSGVGAKEEQFS